MVRSALASRLLEAFAQSEASKDEQLRGDGEKTLGAMAT